MVGHIEHIGSDVKGFAEGERVTLATTVACGHCPYCTIGLGNMCPNAKPISYDYDGAFAEKLAIPPLAIAGGNVIKVPDSVSNEAAALSEPLSCAINAQELAGVKQGDRVVIVGGGPLGAIHAELSKALGAAKVIVIELSALRLDMLRAISGVVLVDASREDVLAVAKEQTGGLGADVVVVCAPAKKAMEDAIKLARKGGAVSFFASLPKDAAELTIDSRAVHYGELKIVGASDSRPEHVSRAVQLIADGLVDTRAVVTHKVALEDIHRGLELMKSQKSLKVLVYPGGVNE
jgi:L-iditol 2-dehydrogenase